MDSQCLEIISSKLTNGIFLMILYSKYPRKASEKQKLISGFYLIKENLNEVIAYKNYQFKWLRPLILVCRNQTQFFVVNKFDEGTSYLIKFDKINQDIIIEEISFDISKTLQSRSSSESKIYYSEENKLISIKYSKETYVLTEVDILNSEVVITKVNANRKVYYYGNHVIYPLSKKRYLMIDGY